MKGRTQENEADPRVARAALIGATAAILLAGCASVEMVDPATVDGRIVFNAVGCPEEVTPNSKSECTSPGNGGKICSKPDREVSWQSVDSSGRAVSQRYRIYFDPFQNGATIKSRPQGFARARIDDKAPLTEYKYIVVGDDCPGAPLDPRIILD